jgi:hypothetical protein
MGFLQIPAAFAALRSDQGGCEDYEVDAGGGCNAEGDGEVTGHDHVS